MADIISICDKLAEVQNKQTADRDKRKRLAVQQMFQCSCCAAVCERCGAQTTPRGRCVTPSGGAHVPYRFCPDCAEEFRDYIDRLKGRGDPELYWRNEAWLEVWSTWINHRAALDRLFRSKEFARLLKEFKDTPSK